MDAAADMPAAPIPVARVAPSAVIVRAVRPREANIAGSTGARWRRRFSCRCRPVRPDDECCPTRMTPPTAVTFAVTYLSDGVRRP
ncbi:hypothetical protein Aca07nite_29340 [Actinoplanes capillaceus]|uniref:Uncharacterized protein n=1 Tax=Actinoplanes campanulatus TaxID=113559 RepID=A0ABQ3WHF0_9ACTN|nr:hypothetical protein Aca07nite_29340 [Actinoplanes capillaceus]